MDPPPFRRNPFSLQQLVSSTFSGWFGAGRRRRLRRWFSYPQFLLPTTVNGAGRRRGRGRIASFRQRLRSYSLIVWAVIYQICRNLVARIKNSPVVFETFLISIHTLPFFWEILHFLTTIGAFIFIGETRFYSGYLGVFEIEIAQKFDLVFKGCVLYYCVVGALMMILPLFPAFLNNILKVVSVATLPVGAVLLGKDFNDPPSTIAFSLFAFGVVCLVVRFDIDMDYGVTDALIAVGLGTLANDDSGDIAWKGTLVAAISACKILFGLLRKYYEARMRRIDGERRREAEEREIV